MRRTSLVLITLLLASLSHAKTRPEMGRPAPWLVERAKEFDFDAFEDDRGGFFLLWTQPEGELYELFAQHISSSGEKGWEDPGLVVAQGLLNSHEWDAFPDAKGGLHVVWTQNARVHAQRLDARHQTFWNDTSEALTSSSFSQKMPTGVADGSGGAYFVWVEKRYPDRSVLVGQHLRDNGSKLWGAEGQRISLRPSDQKRPNVITDGVAGVIIAWNDYREQASQLQIQRLDYQGNMPWDPSGLLVTAPAAGDREWPMIAAVGKGSAVVAWTAGDSGVNRIFLQYIDNKGNFQWGGSGIPVSLQPLAKWNPVVYGDGQGGSWVGWEDYRSQTQWQVYLQHFHQDGKPVWGKEIAVAPAGGGQGNLSIVDSGIEGSFAAWVDNSYGAPALFAQQVDADGNRLWGDSGMAVAKGLTKPKHVQLLLTAPGKAMAFWADEEKSGLWDLYAAPLTPPGTR